MYATEAKVAGAMLGSKMVYKSMLVLSTHPDFFPQLMGPTRAVLVLFLTLFRLFSTYAEPLAFYISLCYSNF